MTTVFYHSDWRTSTKVIDFSTYRVYRHLADFTPGNFSVSAHVPFDSDTIQLNIFDGDFDNDLIFIKFMIIREFKTLLIIRIKGSHNSSHHYNLHDISAETKDHITDALSTMFCDIVDHVHVFDHILFNILKYSHMDSLSKSIGALPNCLHPVKHLIAPLLKPNWFDLDFYSKSLDIDEGEWLDY